MPRATPLPEGLSLDSRPLSRLRPHRSLVLAALLTGLVACSPAERDAEANRGPIAAPPASEADWQQLAVDLHFERSGEFNRWRGRDNRSVGQYRLELRANLALLARVQRDGIEGDWPDLVATGVTGPASGELRFEGEARVEGSDAAGTVPLRVSLQGEVGAEHALDVGGLLNAPPLAGPWMARLRIDIPLSGTVEGAAPGDPMLDTFPYPLLEHDHDRPGQLRMRHEMVLYPTLLPRPDDPGQARVYDSLRATLVDGDPGFKAILTGTWQGATVNGVPQRPWTYLIEGEQSFGDDSARTTDRLRLQLTPVARTLPIPEGWD